MNITADFQPLIDHIQEKVSLSEEEAQEFIACFKLTKVKKRQFIIQPDFVAKYRTYVLQGAFMGYVVADEGQDHIIQLAVEDWWISDYNSYIFQQPATMFVMALEDSIILQLDFASEQKLKSMNHKYETFFRITAERSFAGMQRRMISNLTKTAEERFREFEDNYPQIANRFPQYVIASFLGMTTQYLSKLRNIRVSKKS
jgi:CRP-like cAMP-binding protein